MPDYGLVIFVLSMVLGVLVFGHIFTVLTDRMRLLNEQSILEDILPKSKGQAKINIQHRLDQIQGLL